MKTMPVLGTTDAVPTEEKEVWLHFFRGRSHWLAVESDGHGLLYGCIVKNDDFQNAEWGHFRLDELADLPGMMAFCREKVRRFADVSGEYCLCTDRVCIFDRGGLTSLGCRDIVPSICESGDQD
ncbi:MAG: hypothetical protein PHC98_00155 [Syntrophotalea acetylenica]|nr:hypothetical protein [Syntrophotalea acetylenica]